MLEAALCSPRTLVHKAMLPLTLTAMLNSATVLEQDSTRRPIETGTQLLIPAMRSIREL